MKWDTNSEAMLFLLKTQINLSNSEIAKRLNRNSGSCRTKWERTNWEKFEIDNKEIISEVKNNFLKEDYIDNLIKGLISLSRHDIRRLKSLTKEEFYSRVKLPSKKLPITWTELKRQALYQLEQIGYHYPATKQLGKGTYIIIGDTHGKHTRSGMFELVQNLNDYLEADYIIHIGHALDDDNMSNMYLKEFDNLVVLSKEEELRLLAKEEEPFDIIRREIKLGNLSIQNQDIITDYVQTFISSGIYPEYFENSTIVNLHRHEMDSRCLISGKSSLVASPGCLCEPHIVQTIKQQDFTDGRTVKSTFPSGYKKYRRMRHMMKTWEQGILIVHVDNKGDFTIVQSRIHQTSKGYTASYFDKIITEHGVTNPDLKGFVHADAHINFHDPDVLSIMDQVCKDYQPDYRIDVGDFINHHPLNHYRFAQHGMSLQEDILNEYAQVNYIASKMCEWAPKSYMIKGNHERFAVDFIDKMPQFRSLLEFKFLSGFDNLDVEVTDIKKTKKLGNITYMHGNFKMFGQSGNVYDKMFRTFGTPVVHGHKHHPATRKGCYSIGLTGKMDMEYNEAEASKWVHGFGISNSFEDKAFITTISIINNKCLLNDKKYVPKNSHKWIIPDYKVKVQYTFE